MNNKIPKSFSIAGDTIKVRVEKSLPDDQYGSWCSSTNTIFIATTVFNNKLTREQIMNSFYHELIHCFQFFYDNHIIESEAQVFANFIREFQQSCKY